MQDNTHRFTGRAADYDRYRQRYPAEEIIAHLRDWCGLTSTSLVADIGAGTGMLAEVFLANGDRVLAVEPNAEMREQMRPSVAQRLGTLGRQLEIIDATAEATTLPDASVDIVAAGRAFHWFDQERDRRISPHPEARRLGHADRRRPRPRRDGPALPSADGRL